MKKALSVEIKPKLDVFKSIQQKKIIVIPPLNLKFSKAKLGKNIGLHLSGKKRITQDENEN